MDTVVYEHLAWVMGLFEGDASNLTEAELETRFDRNFLSLVPPDEFISTVRQMAETLGPLVLVEDQSRHAGEFVGLFRAESGGVVMISFALDEESGLMAGFFITPAGSTAVASSPAPPPGSR